MFYKKITRYLAVSNSIGYNGICQGGHHHTSYSKAIKAIDAVIKTVAVAPDDVGTGGKPDMAP